MKHAMTAIEPVHFAKHMTEELTALADERWAALLQSFEKQGISFPAEPARLADVLKKTFVFSSFLAKRCTQNPGILADLIHSGDLARSFDSAAYQETIRRRVSGCLDRESLSKVLRTIRTREMVRIAFRDLGGYAPLVETTRDLSALADACLDTALTSIHDQMVETYGTPTGESGHQQHLVVIGFGKLGGRELNFSSDVDLMFAFPESGNTRGTDKTVSNKEFFTRLCHGLIDVISKNMTDGLVFRVDARLRPYGESGPIAMTFESMEQYYQEQGREWERYALIKARVVAGNKTRGHELLERLKPFIFRRYLDYGTFESLREMKRRIEREVTRKGMKENIKLGPGGIREVEFFGQIFQLIRGGVHVAYQQREILRILDTLALENNIPAEVKDELAAAYVFLRHVENRLQMADDRQTHSLPADTAARYRLSVAMGFEDSQEFYQALDAHMKNVHRHFRALLARDETKPRGDAEMQRITAVWNNLDNTDANRDLIRQLGVDPPDPLLEVLGNFLEIIKSDVVSLQAKKRVDQLVPHIVKASLSSDTPVIVMGRILDLIRAVSSRSCYIALLIENKDALVHLVRLAEASSWIMSFLSKHPLLLDELLDVRTLYEPVEKPDLKKAIQRRFAHLPDADLESRMDDLRIFKQINTLRICAADVAGLLPLMKVSDRLTWLAESILDAVMEMAWAHMIEKYGRPSGLTDTSDKQFGIIGYGKLGGYELGYGSDLDLVFLHTGEKGMTSGGVFPPVDNAQFYVRLGQRMIHLMTAMTQTGKLYEMDMRLRPSGNAGVLVTHIDGFTDYQKNRAWNWEHQALVKARAVGGDPVVQRRFEAIREEILSMERKTASLKKDIREMRARMRAERGSAPDHFFDIKNAPGGIIDIEFLVQFLIMQNACRFPSLLKWTDIVRQLNSLALAGIFDDKTAYILKQAYLVFRFYIHRLTLQARPALLADDQFVDIRHQVVHLWRYYLE